MLLSMNNIQVCTKNILNMTMKENNEREFCNGKHLSMKIDANNYYKNMRIIFERVIANKIVISFFFLRFLISKLSTSDIQDKK